MRQASSAATLVLVLGLGGCGREQPAGTVVTFPGSAVGAEGEVLRRQLEQFSSENPGIRVEVRRTPDILQLDVIWTPEFAAAGWILPLDAFAPALGDFFPAALEACRWRGRLHALPWFVDVGMLYWRTDLLDAPPRSFAELEAQARAAKQEGGLRYGLAWQGARYEGLVTVFLEYLGGFGGRILDEAGRVVVDSEASVRALGAMRDAIHRSGIVPDEALGWQEEQTRFAFQNGQAVFMRNWPYAYPLLQDRERSKVAGRFAVAPMPAAPGGEPTAALGGQQLALSAASDVPEAAWAVIAFLTRADQMLERARGVGQYPPRPSLYGDQGLAEALPVPPDQARRVIERAVPRPVTPVYTELSEVLQIHLHRALSGQTVPREALRQAAREMRARLARAGLEPPGLEGAAP